MKTCPVCQGKVFDDMDTCYNCLHHFEEEVPKPPVEPTAERQTDFQTSYAPQWVMPKEDGSFFRDYLNKYSLFLNNYLKSSNC